MHVKKSQIKKYSLPKTAQGPGTLPGSVLHYPAFHSDGLTAKPVNLTEDDVAEDFAQTYAHRLRFDHDVRRWYVWDGVRWKLNKTEMAFDFARLLCRQHRRDQHRMGSKKAAEGVEHIARRDQRLAVTSEIWNRDPLLLGTPGGTVDLKTGVLREARPEDYITKLTKSVPAPAGAPHPGFTKFLAEATGGDEALQRFLWQWAGYCLTGMTREQVLLFMYGSGGNGKSVLQNVLNEILADYSTVAQTHTFVATKLQRHSTDIAMLHGARLVVASETDKGQAWSESLINQLTGGDPVTARFMREDNFTYLPQCKMMVVGNHRPQLREVNDAARRRFLIVPFVHKPAQPDHSLAAKLRAEYPAILRWMISGCLDWQANGLIQPPCVLKATGEYFEEQDLCGRWLEECCVQGPSLKASASALYGSWCAFAAANGENGGNQKELSAMLTERGFKKLKSGSVVYVGLNVKVATG